MCGRSSLTKNQKEIEERFNAHFYSDALVKYNPLPNYNVAPSHYHPIITNIEQDKIRMFRWGLIPHWAKNEKIGFKMINARVETLLEKAAFKKAISNQRCIVPFDGFYEWKREGNNKVPYRFTLKDKTIFSVAGLWDKWINKDGLEIFSFTLITQKPNEVVGQIHNRMPAILQRDQESIWLDQNLSPTELIQIIGPYPDELMDMYMVSNEVNNVRNNHTGLINPVDVQPGQTMSLF